MIFDAVLVLGSGIREDGSLPPSSIASVQKAVELCKNKIAKSLVFSGRWSYTLAYVPPYSEAQAMKTLASSLGVSAHALHVEDKSVTTVSNICLTKRDIIVPNKWKDIALVSINPQAKRALYNVQYVLGPNYDCNLIIADFTYPPDKFEALAAAETGKLQDAIDFLKNFPRGNEQAIYDGAMADLEENYMGK